MSRLEFGEHELSLSTLARLARGCARRLSVVVDIVPGMPSAVHEMLIEMVRARPSLVAELLADALGMELPVHQGVRVESGELTELAPTEYRADAAVVLTRADTPVLAVVVEVQLSRDQDKRWSWPVYLTTLRARWRCPTVLLVVCVDPGIAAWCATPIGLGYPGAMVTPLVVGPDRMPVVTDVDPAGAGPELAVLSAMAHGADPAHSAVLDALLAALAGVDEQRATLYLDVVLAALPLAARSYLETLMTTQAREYQSDFARRYFFQGEAKGRAEGEAEGRAGAVLGVLEARGVEVPADARTRITECGDLDQLDIWVRRAATADSIHDLLAG